MTIEIYSDPVSDEMTERHEWEGTIGELIRVNGFEFSEREEQPYVASVDGEEIPASLWDETSCAGKTVKLKTAAHVLTALQWAYVALAALTAATLLMRPKTPGQSTTPQGRNLQSADAKGNVAKPNQTVPETIGQFLRYPEYLVPPRRYFADQRTQYLEMFLCVGPDRYAVEGGSVKVGNTPFAGLPGAEFHIYGPGESVAAHGMHWNWYTAPEVGGTSAGTAGLELSSEPASSVQVPAGALTFAAKTVTAAAGWSEGLGIGTNFSVWIPVTYEITTFMQPGPEPVPISIFEGDFSEFEPLSSGDFILKRNGASQFALRIKTVSGTGLARQVSFQIDSNGEGVYVDYVVAAGTGTEKFRPVNREYEVVSIAGTSLTVKAISVSEAGEVDVPSWVSFPAISTTVAAAELKITGGNVYGKWSGPYVACPAGETGQEFELDFFFPSGLGRINDSGDVESVSVQVEIQYQPAGSSTWSSLQKVYTAATLDQIGFTERVSTGAAIRPEFRARRTSAASTDTRTNDKVQWYGLRALLETPTKYEGWTTMAVRIKGLGDIATSSENRVNLLITRLLPTLMPDGSWSAPQPTRDISAAVRHIATKVGYTDAQIDTEELQRLHGIWTSRGETVDAIFDQTTVRAALDVCLSAGMSELTLSDGLITPSREGVRTQFDGPAFSTQNVVGEIKRSFTLRRPDDNDGVQVEYADEGDNFTVKTIDCKLPGSSGFKLQKIRLDGVTDTTRAWRIGMRRAREMVYRRWAYSLTTELDALVARRGDYVPIIADIPDQGQSAIVDSAQGQVINSTEKLNWQEGRSHVVAWRLPNGKLRGPYAATKLGTYSLQVPAGTPLPVNSPQMEPTHLFFGTVEEWSLPAIVSSVRPQSETRTQLQAVNYDARIYADDDNQPE